MASSRNECLAALQGQTVGRIPVFSGLPSLTASGLKHVAVRYSDAHADARKMARAAASTFDLFGFESAVVPFDLCVEAEALGCDVDFQTDVDEFLAPVVSEPLPMADRSLVRCRAEAARSAGRIPLVAEAIAELRTAVAAEIVIGAWVPGPFTLGWQLFGGDAWLGELGADDSTAVLEALADFLAVVACRYRQAGADFITVHEMGGSPQVIGPSHFHARVQPALRRLMAQLPSPTVLSVCGDTNAVVADLACCGADALSVDQHNHVARTREVLGPKPIIFGNVDPVGVLSRGAPDLVARVVRTCIEAGVNAIWPGCDLYPDVPPENIRMLIAAAHTH